MAKENVKLWYKTEITFEGGKVNDPQDPGGKTNMGITQRVYNGYRKGHGLAGNDVYNITPNEVLDIYKVGYWDKVWGDILPSGLDVVVADGAINSGVAQSVKWLQRALGVRVDGIMGDATMAAVKLVDSVAYLIKQVCDLRMKFLRALKTFKRFGKGWTRRVDQLQDLGVKLATSSPAVAPTVAVTGANRKASLEDAKSTLPKLDAVWGAGTGTGVLAQVTAALQPLADVPHVQHILAGITVAGVLLGAAGAAWSWYARKKSDEINDALNIRPSQPVNDNIASAAPVVPEVIDGMDKAVEEAA